MANGLCFTMTIYINIFGVILLCCQPYKVNQLQFESILKFAARNGLEYSIQI